MTFTDLTGQIAAQDAVEWIGLLTGIAYVMLAAYEKPSCWIFGIISSVAIAWKSFSDYKLIADGLLQVFYIVIGFVGLWNWWRGGGEDQKKPIVISPLLEHAIAIAVCFLLAIPMSWFLIRFAGARFGYLDTLITLASIWATVLLVRKELYNWIYWVVLDFMLIFLLFVSGGYLFSLLYLIYMVVAIWGFIKWKKQSVRA